MSTRRFDHVFVLCTGRCGSLTLARACGHLTNYTAGHESRWSLIGEARLDYPTGHIEVDNRLSWFLGRLGARFGREAGYVHLTRDPEAVAASYLKRRHFGIMRAYGRDIIWRPGAAYDPALAEAIARDYVATVTANIEAFLADKPHVLAMRLETLPADFERFCDWAGAEGDLDAARDELTVRHNRSRSGKGEGS